MIRLITTFMLAIGLSFAGPVGGLQAAESVHHTRKPAKLRKPAEPAAQSAPHSINAPSTDFSKIERGDDGSGGPDGPTFRPSMGAGGMGLGGSF